MLAFEVSGLSVVISALLGVGVLVMLAGILAGQFRRGVVEELRNSLDTASTEIAIARQRADRLEGEIQALRHEVEALRSENQTLRSVLTEGVALREVVAEEVGRGVARVIEYVDRNKDVALDIQAQVLRSINEAEARVLAAQQKEATSGDS